VLFRSAAMQGHTGAQTNLAMLLIERGDGQDDLAEAVDWLAQAGAKGVVQAQYALGRVYAQPGAFHDDQEAVWWLKRAAQQGMAEAQASLAVMVDQGRGVEQDPAEAARWYRLAAEQDWPRAQHMLGYFYQTGRGVTKDLATAYHWFTLAAANGYEPAKRYRERLGFKITPEQYNTASAMVNRWYAERETQAASDSGLAGVETE